jgi:hypothetical protein
MSHSPFISRFRAGIWMSITSIHVRRETFNPSSRRARTDRTPLLTHCHAINLCPLRSANSPTSSLLILTNLHQFSIFNHKSPTLQHPTGPRCQSLPSSIKEHSSRAFRRATSPPATAIPREGSPAHLPNHPPTSSLSRALNPFAPSTRLYHNSIVLCKRKQD